MRQTRSKDGADPNSAIRTRYVHYEHTSARFSSLCCRVEVLLKNEQEAFIGPIANGGAARDLLKVSRRPPNYPNHTILQGTVVCMVVLVEHESSVMSDLDDRPISVEG